MSEQGNKTNLLKMLEITWTPTSFSDFTGKQPDGSLVDKRDASQLSFKQCKYQTKESAECLQSVWF